jgi:hypothetical protein
MEPKYIQILIEKYLNGLATPEEIRLVEEFYASFETEPGLTSQLDQSDVDESIKRGFSSIMSALNK